MSPHPPRVLCVSHDPRLLRSREQVISKRYRVVTLQTLEQLIEVDAPEGFSLVLLCHTLSKQDCRSTLEIVRARWPEAKVLVMYNDAYGCADSQVDSTVRALDGPWVLLRQISGLLATSS